MYLYFESVDYSLFFSKILGFNAEKSVLGPSKHIKFSDHFKSIYKSYNKME